MTDTTPFYTCEYDKAFKEIMMKKEKFEIAKNLLEQNVDIDVIMSATGLTKEEIEKL